MHRTPTLAATLAAALASAAPTCAEACRLALVLALDVSGSVSRAEDRLQREGLAAALLAPPVARAALTGGPIALYAFEWAGASSQAPLLPGWRIVDGEADLLAVAQALRKPRGDALRAGGLAGDGTAVGAALVHAAAALASAPDCQARTIDVSGDGVSSDGIEPRTVIDGLLGGVTVNALVIDRPLIDPFLEIMQGGDRRLVDWFDEVVVHGPSAFSVVADGYEDYERAMTVKLTRELALPLVGGEPRAGNGA